MNDLNNLSIDDLSITFPVDLTEEEVVSMQMLIEKRLGRLRLHKMTTVILGFYALLTAVFTTVQWWKTGQIDWIFVAGLLLMLALFAAILWYIPYTFRKQAQKAYRQRNFTGYYGMVTMTIFSIMKTSASIVDGFSLNQDVLYVETQDGMAFVPQQGKFILLPARCLTEEDAAFIRRVVFASGSRLRTKVFARMQARATAHIPERDDPVRGELPLMRCDIQYTEEEWTRRQVQHSQRQMMTVLPVRMGIAIAIGMSVGMYTEQFLSGLLVGLAILVIGLLLPWWRVRRRQTDREREVECFFDLASGYV